MNDMFCFQCEQTAGCTGCTGRAGVCGKSAEVAVLEDKLTGALISLSVAVEGKEPSDEMIRVMIDGLFSTITNVDFSADAISALIDEVHSLSGTDDDFDMNIIWDAPEDLRSLKSLILFGIRGVAAYASHARILGLSDATVDAFFFEALRTIAGSDDADTLLSCALGVGEVNLTCMGLLDRANTGTYGDPEPATVSLDIEAGPFIIVTGHDLRDLELVLKATEGKGVNVYTHGEMLPAHGYPKLCAYPQLKGNFGTAWQNQRTEFADVPAPILFTTNCLMPPAQSYADRVFTTGEVRFDGMPHIDDDKDFSALVERAIELGGYGEKQELTGINGGHEVMTGFGRATVLGAAGTVIDAVNAGDLKHIFLVGGCDGARKTRSYYTDFVKETPSDTLVLTLACGKYRFNDLDLGTLGGLPRLLDMGQCNDAYGAIQVAVALAGAFDCGVNDLPLSMVLSWYEQKAVCILLTLLHLGIKDIYLGPTLPAFVSPGVLDILVKNYNIHPTTTPEADMAAMLA